MYFPNKVGLSLKKKLNIIAEKTLYSGFFKVNEFTFKHRKHDGSWSKKLTREVFGEGEVVTVLPYDPKTKKILLIDQFRNGLIKKKHNPIIKEIVGGYVDKNESPKQAAIRECKEETGCTVKKIKKIFSYYPAPGSSQSYYHFFLAEIISFDGFRIVGKKDENEDILVRSYNINSVKKMLNERKIINGLTLIALQWFYLNYKNI